MDSDSASKLPWSSAHELRDLFLKKQISAVDLSRTFLDRARDKDGDLGAFLSLDEDFILAQAKALDEKRARGQELGALAGVPITIKDNLCVRGQVTSAASKILDGFVSPYDAHVVEQIKKADGLLFGKSNLDEFAMGSSTENSGRQITKNPWNHKYVPGGSSGGSAAAVAAALLPLALGSDTGGSIRQPAALCGVYGLKPSYGRVSRFGLLAFASSLDQVGPFARSPQDLALFLEVIAGHDRRDSTSSSRARESFAEKLHPELGGLTLGLPREFFEATLDPEVAEATKTAAKTLEELGAKIVEVSLSLTKYAIPCYQILSTAEASSNLARYDGVHYGHRSSESADLGELYARSRSEGFGAEVQRRIMLGTFVLSTGFYDAYYLKAQKVRQLIREEHEQVFQKCDALLSPVSPVAGFALGERVHDPLLMYNADALTVSANLVGIPGLSIPCGFSKLGLPIGLQVLGPQWSEQRLLDIAQAYHLATDHHRRRPEGYGD